MFYVFPGSIILYRQTDFAPTTGGSYADTDFVQLWYPAAHHTPCFVLWWTELLNLRFHWIFSDISKILFVYLLLKYLK